MKHYYIVEIEKYRFGERRRVTVKAVSAEEATKNAVVSCGERIVAVWRL